MGLITEAAAPYILGGAAVIALALGGTIAWQHHHIKALDAENIKLRGAATAYADAQKTNLGTIADLQASLRNLVAVHRADEKAAEKVADAWMRRTERAQADLFRTQQELHDVYAKSATARAWGATGVDADVLAKLPKPAATHGH